MRACCGVVVLLILAAGGEVWAQGLGDGQGDVAVELAGGYAGFVDDATVHHALVGGAVRWYVRPRVSLGPEVVYMRGPREDRDLMITGNLTVDLRGPERSVVPFVVVGAGLFRHRDRFNGETFSSGEGAFTGGVGVRAALGRRWYAGGEWRLGWELHSRVSGFVGLRFGS